MLVEEKAWKIRSGMVISNSNCFGVPYIGCINSFLWLLFILFQPAFFCFKIFMRTFRRKRIKHTDSSTIHPPRDPFAGWAQSTSKKTLADSFDPFLLHRYQNWYYDGNSSQNLFCSDCVFFVLLFCLLFFFFKHNKNFPEITKIKQHYFLCYGHHCGNY